MRPGSSAVFCDGNRICAKEDRGYAVDIEEGGGERGRVWRRERRARGQVFEKRRGY